jgi:pyruvate carboxylase subunit B
MEYEFTYLGKSYKVRMEKNSNIVTINDKDKFQVEAQRLGPHTLSLAINNELTLLHIAFDDSRIHVFVKGSLFILKKKEKKEAYGTKEILIKPTGNTVNSSMPGALVKLLVQEGQKVNRGETVAIVEAMKMENELKAPITGIVKRINFKEGDQVDAFTPIVELEE